MARIEATIAIARSVSRCVAPRRRLKGQLVLVEAGLSILIRSDSLWFGVVSVCAQIRVHQVLFADGLRHGVLRERRRRLVIIEGLLQPLPGLILEAPLVSRPLLAVVQRFEEGSHLLSLYLLHSLAPSALLSAAKPASRRLALLPRPRPFLWPPLEARLPGKWIVLRVHRAYFVLRIVAAGLPLVRRVFEIVEMIRLTVFSCIAGHAYLSLNFFSRIFGQYIFDSFDLFIKM